MRRRTLTADANEDELCRARDTIRTIEGRWLWPWNHAHNEQGGAPAPTAAEHGPKRHLHARRLPPDGARQGLWRSKAASILSRAVLARVKQGWRHPFHLKWLLHPRLSEEERSEAGGRVVVEGASREEALGADAGQHRGRGLGD